MPMSYRTVDLLDKYQQKFSDVKRGIFDIFDEILPLFIRFF